MIISAIIGLLWVSGLLPVAFFFFYTTGIFFIDDYLWFAGIAIFNLFLILILRKNIIRVFRNLLLFMPFVALTVLFNFLLNGWESALLVATRLTLVCNFTYIFVTSIGGIRFARGVESILFPLKLFRVKTRNISLIIAVALTFIPVIFRETKVIREGMHARGLRRPKLGLFFSIISYKILYRASTLSDTLNAKGYQ